MNSEDIFNEAFNASLQEDQNLIPSETLRHHNTVLTDKNMNYVQAKNWKGLKEAIEEGHLKRFNDILNRLPDREFARMYLKILPFFKPKSITREGSEKNNVTQINIQINNSKGEITEQIKEIE